MEGDFFKGDAEQTETQPKKVALITDFNELCNVFSELTAKIKLTTNQGYEAILPIRNELIGGGDGMDDQGQVGTLKKKIQDSAIKRMDIGIMMWAALRNIEDLDRWTIRYNKYLEQHLDALSVVSRSGFKIVAERDEEIQKLKVKIKQMEAATWT